MSQTDVQAASFEEVNDRLKQIVDAVSDEELPLDEALDLFDEAVALGMKASEMLEDDIATRDAADEEREALQAAADAAADAELDGAAPAEGQPVGQAAPQPAQPAEEDASRVPAWARSAMAQADGASDEAVGSADSDEPADVASEAGPEEAPSPEVELDAESDLGTEEA